MTQLRAAALEVKAVRWGTFHVHIIPVFPKQTFHVPKSVTHIQALGLVHFLHRALVYAV